MRSNIWRRFNPWVVIFVGTALFHTWRGSWQDVAIFGLTAIFMLTQVFGLTRLGLSQKPSLPTSAVILFSLLMAVVLFLVPRHSLLSMIAMVALIPIGIALLLYRDEKVQRQPSHIMMRSRIIWSTWAVGFALVELVAYVGSKLSGDLTEYPTISVILDPVLDTGIGRATFVVLWLAAGVYLFGIRRKR